MNGKIPLIVAAITLGTMGNALAQSTGTPNNRVGMGPLIRGNAAVAERIEQLRSPRRTVPYLTGSFVKRPVTVQGKGAATVVAGNLAINTTNQADSLIKVKCPNAGHKIIVRNNKVINQGQIVSSRAGGTAGAMVIQCDGTRSTIEITGNTVSGGGKIIGR